MNIIRITEHLCEYTITYNSNPESLNIVCVHLEECYKWTYTLMSKIVDFDSRCSNMNIELSPKFLFEIFDSYRNNKLNSIFSLKFPECQDDWKNRFVIGLGITLPECQNYRVVRQLNFRTVPISEIERLHMKLSAQKEKYDNKLNTLKTLIEHIQTEMNSLRSDNLSLKGKINDFEKNI